MLTEKELSKQINSTILSPIRVGNLIDLKIDRNDFLNFMKPYFNDLENDNYLVRQKQINFLKANFKEESKSISRLHRAYFEGSIDMISLKKWIDQLSTTQKEKYKAISIITRQRSIASFDIFIKNHNIIIERIPKSNFTQNVDDFRVWKRIFSEASKASVENDYFNTLLEKITKLVKEIHPEIKQLKITTHLMRTLAQENIPGENAPEGIHEDGAKYIVSALVINRENVSGGKSSIYEQIDNQIKKPIFQTELLPGEFIFQADTGEEKHFGNDLWHNVSAIYPTDINTPCRRDIIGLDIDIVN